MAVLTEYTWIFVVAIFFAFFAAFGIGANDVANSFASSVGAKAITIGQACLIAAFCEFGGAVLLGAEVTDTIKNKIANTAAFQSTPELLMFGMFCVLVAAAFWDNMACHLELPVSTTHTTVGAVVGMALVIRGGSAVNWSSKQDGFPFINGYVVIIVSWFASPIAAGILVFILYGILRTFVLRKKRSFDISCFLMPVFIWLTFFVIVIFIIQTGGKNKRWTAQPDGKTAWISAVIATGFAAIVACFIPWLRRSVEKQYQQDNARIARAAEAAAMENGEKVAVKDADGKVVGAAYLDDVNINDSGNTWFLENKWNQFKGTGFGKTMTQNRVWKAISYGSSFDCHACVEEDTSVAAVWAHAEKFDFKTERLYRYLQVFSACVMSFAHGSNDVANAMGPFSAVYTIWNTGKVSTSTPVPVWILVLGGAGIVTGLALYGYKIMRVLGVKAVKLTNTRGFCAELCTASTVIVASRYGLPISTTQVVTGAIIAIGLFEGVKGVNWKIAGRILFGWVITTAVAGCVAALVTALGVFTPNKNDSDELARIAAAAAPVSG